MANLPTKKDNYNDEIKSTVSSNNLGQQELIANQMAIMKEREKLLKGKLEANEKKKSVCKVGKTQTKVIKALRKEMKLENMIKI